MGAQDPILEETVGLPGEMSAVGKYLFRQLLEQGTPISPSAIAAVTGDEVTALEAKLADAVTAGRLRLDTTGAVVAVGGLSVTPTAHRIMMNGDQRWTWCALDAIGILGALGADGTIESTDPHNGETISMAVVGGVPHTNAAVFILDGFGEQSVVDAWCPQVNFFENPHNAAVWAEKNGLQGTIVPASELAENATLMWEPMVRDQ